MTIKLPRLFILMLILTVSGCAKRNTLLEKPVVGIANDALLQKPIVGIMQNDQVPILIKGVSKGKVRINYGKTDDSNTASTEWKNLSNSDDFSASLILNDLEYDTGYKYQVEFASGEHSEWFEFKSFPTQNEAGKFSFVFSACQRENYLSNNIYKHIEMNSPTFIALLGDQMYGDYDGNLNKLEEYLANDSLMQLAKEEGETILSEKSVLQAFRNKYHRTFGENFQKMSSSIPIMGIWDDHDYGKDNSDATYSYKEEAQKVFKENYPSYPYEVEDGGIYYSFSIADVDFFVLDTRWYRSPMENAEGESKTMLGDEQLTWLLNGLKQSSAPFKIIFSSVPMNDYGGDTSSGREGYDSWMGYKYERSKIISFISDNNIRGVLVFSGDQHYPSAHILNWKSPLTAVSKTDSSIKYLLKDLGNAVFDFSASPLNYKVTTGHPLISENQENPEFSYEIYRVEWAKPENKIEGAPRRVASIYGVAEFDTKMSPKKVSVKFFELDPETSELIELYQVVLTSE